MVLYFHPLHYALLVEMVPTFQLHYFQLVTHLPPLQQLMQANRAHSQCFPHLLVDSSGLAYPVYFGVEKGFIHACILP